MSYLLGITRTPLIPSKTYRFSGATLNYEVMGKGAPLILLHGSMIGDPWNGFEQLLAKSYTVYAPHLPGFGASEVVKGRLHNTNLFSEALCAFIKHLHLEKAPLIALSLGTVVAVKAASCNGTTGPLILVGLPIRITSEKLKRASLIPVWLRRMICSTVWGRKNILLPVLRDILGTKEDEKGDRELLAKLQTTDTKSLVDFNVHEEVNLTIPQLLPKLKNEVTCIYGSKDNLLDRKETLLKDVLVIKDAHHNVFTSQPKRLLELLKKTLS